VFRPEYLLADHQRPIDYQIPLPEGEPTRHRSSLYVLAPRGRKGRAIDTETERFVDETRISVSP
jgi:hopanoid C-3 methylase